MSSIRFAASVILALSLGCPVCSQEQANKKSKEDMEREEIREMLLAEYVTQAIEWTWICFSVCEKAGNDEEAELYRNKLNVAWFNYFVLTQGASPVVKGNERFVRKLLPQTIPVIQKAERFDDPWALTALRKIDPSIKLDGTWGMAAKRFARFTVDEYSGAVKRYHKWINETIGEFKSEMQQ